MASFVPKGVFRIFKRRGWTNWGKNQNPQKFPEPKINPQKILYRTTHRQNYSVKIKPTKKILSTFFLPQKNPGIENFKPKKSFYHRRHLKSGLPQLEFRSTPNFLIKSLLMAYFITAKQIVEYEAESERPDLLQIMTIISLNGFYESPSKLNRVSLVRKWAIMFTSDILMIAHCCNWLLILFSNMLLSRVTEVGL